MIRAADQTGFVVLVSISMCAGLLFLANCPSSTNPTILEPKSLDAAPSGGHSATPVAVPGDRRDTGASTPSPEASSDDEIERQYQQEAALVGDTANSDDLTAQLDAMVGRNNPQNAAPAPAKETGSAAPAQDSLQAQASQPVPGEKQDQAGTPPAPQAQSNSAQPVSTFASSALAPGGQGRQAAGSAQPAAIEQATPAAQAAPAGTAYTRTDFGAASSSEEPAATPAAAEAQEQPHRNIYVWDARLQSGGSR